MKVIKRKKGSGVGKLGRPAKNITVSYRLPASVRKALSEAAARRGTGKSALVELAIRRLLKLAA